MAVHEEQHGEGAPEWMVSFADMVTIMMAFFVVMYSMAGRKDEKAIQPIVSSLKQQFGPDWPFANLTLGPNRPRNPHLDRLKLKGHTRVELSRGGDGQQPGRTFSSSPMGRVLRPGEHLVAGGTLYFERPTADLNHQQELQLQKAVVELAGKMQKIEIRGHTSRRPLPADSPYHDLWDLAYARCRSTMEYLVSQGVDPRRIRMTVSGGNEPAITQDVATALRKDSRVEVFLLNEFAGDGSG